MSRTMPTSLDERDEQILARRYEAFEAIDGPREGDFVRFADGVERRISYITPLDWLPECDSVQTSEGGSFYMGEHGLSFSGSLHLGVKRETLALTDERRLGTVWFFHHDYRRAHNGVDFKILCRVYECSEPSTL